ncbi:MAG: hypothetical protein ACI4XR_04680 [Bacilli bacterium]
MKNRILTFIIGALTGAIIMTLVFLIFNKSNDNTNIGNFPPQENGEMQRPNGNMGEPLEKSDGNMQLPPQ